MLFNNLAIILKSLGQKELKNFETFISCDYFSIPEDVVTIFHFMLKKIHNASFEGVSENDFLKKIINQNKLKILVDPTEVQLKKKVAKLTWSCMRVIEKFLIINELEQNDFTQTQLLLKAYRNRQPLLKFYKKQTKKILSDLEKKKTYNHSYYFKNYLIHEDIYFHPNTSKSSIGIQSQKQMLENFDAYFYMNKLRLGIEMLLRKNWANDQLNFLGLKEAIAFAKKQHTPQFHFYIQLYQLTKVKKFQEIKIDEAINNFKENIDAWNFKDQRLLYQFLSNYLIHHANKNNQTALRFKAELIDIGLENNILMDKIGIMTDNTFLNCVTTYLRVYSFEKTQNFIDSYQEHLAKPTSESVVNISTALLKIEEKKFLEAHEILNETFNKFDHHKIRIHTARLKCILELFLTRAIPDDQFLYFYYSYYRYFSNQTVINSDRKKEFINFGKAVLKIFQIGSQLKLKTKSKEKKLQLNNLYHTLKVSSKKMILKKWFLERLKQLIKEV
ncbi:MAG: hypothetical protein ACI85O_001020 [Saprospiraceae bacterium]|jgi:hypothetical protein